MNLCPFVGTTPSKKVHPLQVRFVLIILASILSAPILAQAETYVDATNAYCEKIKQCTLQQIRTGKGITGADERMALNKVDEMCATLQQNPMAPIGSPSHGLATICMRSLAGLTCGQIFGATTANPTQECANFTAFAQ